jgi:hypothetical protein
MKLSTLRRWLTNFILPLLLTAQFACKRSGQPGTPVEMNNYLIGINKDLKKMGADWGARLMSLNDTGDYTKLIPVRKSLENYINDKKIQIKALKDVGGSWPLRKSFLDFMDDEKKLVTDGLIPFEKFTKNTPAEEISEARRKLLIFTEEEKNQMEKIQLLQQEYAEKNNFTIIEEKAEQPKTAMEMNNYLVGVTTELNRMGGKWADTLQADKKTGNYNELIPMRESLEKFIDKKTLEIKGMDDVAGSETFRASILDFLKYEKQLLEIGFIPFEKLTKNSSEAEIEKVDANLLTTVQSEETELNKVKAAQAEYAKRNGINLHSGI